MTSEALSDLKAKMDAASVAFREACLAYWEAEDEAANETRARLIASGEYDKAKEAKYGR